MHLTHRVPLAALVLAGCAAASAAMPRAAASQPHPAVAAARDRTADSLRAVIDQGAPGWLARFHVPSLAVAYVRDGAVAWTRVYGEQAPGVPATERTLYNVASLTKPVFAETMLRMAAAGRLSLDEPMAPAWVDPDLAGDPRARLLTPRLALSHQLGFANWRRETGGVLRFKWEPGTGFHYSGEGFEYAARFASRKAGAPLDSLARQYVFRPFGMTETSWRPGGRADRIARPMGPEGRYGDPATSPGGNAADDLYTTIGDYAAFLAGVMKHDGLPARLVAQRDSIHALDTGPGAQCDRQKVARCPGRIGYGLGWSVMEYADGPVLWHTGSDWGEKAMVFYFPARSEGVVMLTNGANGFQVMIEAGIVLAGNTAFAEYLAAGRP
ncbi:MAG TPA: serine hydrolase domain-containing protein [Longimicrobium sp.]|nr:serine hydrolase domain-containing protein [Longimicrobium sp.]